MRCRKIRQVAGSGLSQYAIIIALVAVALVPVFLIFGKLIFNSFKAYTNDYGAMSAQVQQNTLKPAPEPLTNTPVTPPTTPPASSMTVDCSSGSCTMNYGDMILTGLPDDFPQFVATGGASGGTDELAKILEQIAAYLENKGDTANAADVKALATLGHEIALMERTIPTHRCTDHPNSVRCYPDDPTVLSMIGDFNNKIGDFNSLMGSVLSRTSANPQLNSIISTPANEIASLAQSVSTSISENTYTDHFCMSGIEESYTGIATKTDIDAAIVCKAGYGADNGYQCN